MSIMQLEDVSPKFNEAVLNGIIKDYGGNKCTSWRFADGQFGKGDSYLSEVFRIEVEDETSRQAEGDTALKVNLVVKCIPKNVARRKTFRSADFFRNEINFYNVVMSEFYKFQKEKQPKNPFNDISK